MLVLTIIQILDYLLTVVRWIIFIQVILSLLISFNVINMSNDFVRAVWNGLDRLTEPVYRPLRRILPDTRPLDLAPMAALVVIVILQIILNNIAASLIVGGTI